MQTWKEYYDDWRQNILSYREHANITPRLFMGYAAEAMIKVQNRSHVMTATKTVSPDSGTLDTYEIGQDVLEFITVADQYGELRMQSIQQQQREGEQFARGFNEEPFNFSVRKNLPNLGNWGSETRLYSPHLNKITVYPAYSQSENLTIRYFVKFHRFSSASAQWAAWFPDDTAFDSQFTTAVLDPQVLGFDEAIMAWASFKYYQSIRNDLYKDYFLEYKEALDTIIANKQTSFIGVSPYNMSAYQ